MKKLFTLIAATLMAVGASADEITLWEGEAVVNGWGNQPTFLSDTGTELKNAGAQVGDQVIFYASAPDDNWQIQLVEGHWGPTYAVYAGQPLYDEDTGEPLNNEVVNLVGGGTFSLTLTEEILEAAYTQKWWGGVFLLNGDGNVTVTKLVLKTAIDYATEAKAISFDENGFIAASEFEGLNDKAKIAFTYNVSGDLSSYTNWGIGRVGSNDDEGDGPSVTVTSLSATALGDLTATCYYEEIKNALAVTPDGIVFSVWGFGDGACVGTRVKVEAFDVISGEEQGETLRIKWTEKVSAGNLADTYADATGTFVLNRLFDTDDKHAIDANNAYFGTADNFEKFEYRFKVGGKSQAEKNVITLTVPADGTLKVYVRSASGDATNRNLTLAQDGTTLYDEVVKDEDAVAIQLDEENTSKAYPVVSVAVKAGTVEVGYPTGALNFYGFDLVSGTATGIETVAATQPVKTGVTYNLRGQRVDENYRGVVIRDGKKFFQK